jgi:hypothetical protein
VTVGKVRPGLLGLMALTARKAHTVRLDPWVRKAPLGATEKTDAMEKPCRASLGGSPQCVTMKQD